MEEVPENSAGESSAGTYVLSAQGRVAEDNSSENGSFSIPSNHDSGAAGSIAASPKKKISKKKLLKELKEAVEKNNFLREQVSRLSAEQSLGETLRQVRSTTRDDVSETRSEFLSTMSNWTLGTLNIPECIPTDGETEIDKRAYEFWKETLVASLQLVNSADEQAKFGVFRIKAGAKLREIFNTTVSTAEMPNERTAPFANALARLDDYFGSRTYILSQRGKLMNLCQTQSEASVEFVRRVATAAKLCNYGTDEEMEAVVRVITKGANDSRIRVLAHRNWVRQGTMKDLIDLVRDRELEIANEEEFRRTHNRNDTATVATVSGATQESFGRFQGNYRGNWRGMAATRGSRGAPRGGRGFRQGLAQNPRGINCWRCGSNFHQQFLCPIIDKVCHKCGKAGHIARVCNRPSQQAQHRSWKRQSDPEDYGVPRKIAAIESTGPESEGCNEVRKSEEDPE
nr:uncharacterized protein LOC115270988 [Aedes albopictus]